MDDEIEHGAAPEAAASDAMYEALDADGGQDFALSDDAPPAPSPDPRRRSHAQARIDEVTRARREAERERDYWRERAAGGADAAPREAEGPADSRRPTTVLGPDDEHRNDGEGREALDPAQLLARIRDEARAELMAEAAAYGQAHAAHEAEAAWEGRQASYLAQRPDYADAVLGARWACSEVMADAIQDSDAGPALAYHLARNPDQAAAIATMSPLGQVRALGRIEAGLVEDASDGAGAALSVSHAPAPPPSVRGSGGRFRPAPDTDDFTAFDRAYGAK